MEAFLVLAPWVVATEVARGVQVQAQVSEEALALADNWALGITTRTEQEALAETPVQ